MPTKTQIREHVKKLTLFDDVLMRKAAEDKDFCEEIIRIILEDEKLYIVSYTPQKDMVNLQGRSVVFDLLCKLSNGKIVNVEVQKTDNLNHIFRVRYNSSIISTNITDTGAKFDNIPKLIIIYITKFDIFKKGDVKYIVESTLKYYGDIVDDGLTRIFVNSESYDGSRLAKLMQVFAGDKNFIENFPKTHERISLFTEKEEGINIMSNIIEEIFGEDLRKAREEAKKDGIEEGKNEIVNSLNEMIKNNCTIEEIKQLISTEMQKSPAC